MELIDREEFASRMKNLDDEEKSIVVKTIPDEMLLEELNRRLKNMKDRINKVKEIFNVQEIE